MNQLLYRLAELNISIVSNGDKLDIYDPDNALTDDLILLIKENKSELLTLLGKVSPYSHRSIPLSSKTGGYVLSSAQRRLYFLYEYDNSSTAYNIPQSILLEGKLDRARLEDSFRRLISRHESLRTSFGWQGEEPVQRISETVDFAIEEIRDTGEEGLRSFCRPFDLGKAPLLRVGLQTLGAEEHVLMVDMHHIITDGVSQGILIEDFMRFYRGEEPVPLALQYKDYAEWQQSEEERSALAVQQGYWEEEYAEGPPVLELPTDHARPHQKSYEGSSAGFRVDSSTTRRLKAIGEEQGATMFMVILSVYTILLSKISNQEDIVVGVPTAGRDHTDLEGVIGMFVNTLAIRNHVEGGQSYRNYLSAVKAKTLSGFRNQSYQYEQLIDLLKIERDPGRNPLFDVMLAYQNFEQKEIRLGDLKITPHQGDRTTTKFDLALFVMEDGEELAFELGYSTGLFTAATIKRFQAYLEAILSSVSRDPDVRLDQIEILSEAEREEQLSGHDQTAVPYPEDATLVSLFEAQVLKSPGQVAIRTGRDVQTYREVHAKSQAIAGYLRSVFHVQPGDLIGVLLERESELIPVLYGILTAGCAYVPIDPHFPAERINTLISGSGLKVLVSRQRYLGPELRLPAGLIDLDRHQNKIYDSGLSGDATVIKGQDLCYVLYTSGSTGKPKGVMIEHRSVVNRLLWMQKEYPLTAGDVLLQKTPVVFDVSVWELFWWSLTGASVSMLAAGAEKDPAGLVSAIEENQVSVLHFVPSMLSVFLHHIDDEEGYSRLKSVRRVFSSGEALKADQADQFAKQLHRNNGTGLVNLYGPTEATVDVSYYECRFDGSEQSIPIGKAIDNTWLYVLNSSGQLCPYGVPGELYIGGRGVGRGYLGNEKLTAEKFIPDPFHRGMRMYRTGDLVKRRLDGEIEYLSRLDDQVKLRGFRIEPGEIEVRLSSHAGIRETTVTIKEKRGERHLVAYYTSTEAIAEGELREMLRATLPQYMVPTYYCRLASLPLTPNGKLNKKALPEPELRATEDFAKPKNELQKELVTLWADLLGVDSDRIGINTNFFDIGGNSLLLLSMVKKVNSQFNTNISVAQMFNLSVISSIAQFIMADADESEDIENNIEEGLKQLDLTLRLLDQ